MTSNAILPSASLLTKMFSLLFDKVCYYSLTVICSIWAPVIPFQGPISFNDYPVTGGLKLSNCVFLAGYAANCLVSVLACKIAA